MRNAYYMILFTIPLALLITACNGINSGSTVTKNYYQGYNSLDIQFLQDSPPYTFYYDSTGTDNEIPVVVQVKNLGASDAFGVIFVHGFDPHIMQVAGGQLPSQANIQINLGNGGGGFSFNVGGIYIGLKGNGGGAVGANVGFRTPTGVLYGTNVFLQNGKVQGINININDVSRTGSRAGQIALAQFATNLGWSSVIALQGNTPDNPGGGIEVYDFPTYVYYLPASLDQFQQPVMITACYSYATHATMMVCIDPRPNSNVKKACTVNTIAVGSGQGGPVGITSVTEQAAASKVVFTVNIHLSRQNSLDDVFDLNNLYKCDPNSGQLVKPTDKNIVYIDYVALSGHPETITCSNNGVIRLDDSGSGQISCTAQLNSVQEAAYEAPLEIELAYGYSKSIYRYVQIKRV